MKKTLLFLIFLLLYFTANAQIADKSTDIFPKFDSCKSLKNIDLENCFYTNVQDFVYNNFKIPENLSTYKGTIIVLFEITETGKFKTIYIDSNEKLLSDESQRVFNNMPTIEPPTFNGKPTYSKYTIKIAIPLMSSVQILKEKQLEKSKYESSLVYKRNKELTEYDSLIYKKFNNPQFESRLNIQFSHSLYSQFDQSLNQVGSNNHTATKPLNYSEVSKYYDFAAANEKIKQKAIGWWRRKLFNENLVEIQGDNYWFTFNPILDLQVGKSFSNQNNSTYVNTRGIQFQGGLGNKLNFSTTIFESQGFFADYYNKYANSIRPDSSFPADPNVLIGDPAVIPGIGIAKEFNGSAFDFPSAEANITFAPNQFMNMQLGYGRNFIGDGYRSLLQSDGASPYPFFKLNTNFWKIKYTNTYMFMKDIRADAILEKTYSTKYIANHYLSWNVSKRMNIGLFESVIWANTNGRGFDVNFLNPIIFYRTVEFASSARTGNAILGLSAKYKFNNQINLYSQLIIDEFSTKDIKAQNNSWKNKFGYQVGAKYYNAFNIENLFFQLEYNYVRPYVYSHLSPSTNYGHNNENLGHQWGGNFQEFIAISRYNKDRYFIDAKLTFGVRGLDFDPSVDNFNYGNNIYRSYNENRPFDSGVLVGQGNKTDVFIADIQFGYLLNPVTNLKIFGNFIYRSFNPEKNTSTLLKENTTWISAGIRSDIFNWYRDY
jgi:hypothetical protein